MAETGPASAPYRASVNSTETPFRRLAMKAVWLVALTSVTCCSASAAPLAGADYFATLQAADRAYDERRYPAAESLYARLAENGQDVWVWYRLGQARVQQKRYLLAADAYRHALPLGTQRA